MINVKKLSIPEIIIIDPQIFNDERGYFFESYNAERFAENGIPENFVQDNQRFNIQCLGSHKVAVNNIERKFR